MTVSQIWGRARTFNILAGNGIDEVSVITEIPLDFSRIIVCVPYCEQLFSRLLQCLETLLLTGTCSTRSFVSLVSKSMLGRIEACYGDVDGSSV